MAEKLETYIMGYRLILEQNTGGWRWYLYTEEVYRSSYSELNITSGFANSKKQALEDARNCAIEHKNKEDA